MVVKKKYRVENGIQLYLYYSDKDVYLLQQETGTIYSLAIDVETSNYHYIETNTPIELSEEERQLREQEKLKDNLEQLKQRLDFQEDCIAEMAGVVYA